MRISLSLGFVGLLIALVGCGTPESKLAGHYNGKATISSEVRSEMASAGANADLVIRALEATTYSLDLKDDKTFTVTISMMSDKETKSGTWSIANDRVLLVGSELGRMPTTLTPGKDGKTLTALNDGSNPGLFTFTKD